MNTIEHFKKLYSIAKENSIDAALKHDFQETMNRHPEIAAPAIYIFGGIPSKVPVPEPAATVYVPTVVRDRM